MTHLRTDDLGSSPSSAPASEASRLLTERDAATIRKALLGGRDYRTTEEKPLPYPEARAALSRIEAALTQRGTDLAQALKREQQWEKERMPDYVAQLEERDAELTVLDQRILAAEAALVARDAEPCGGELAEYWEDTARASARALVARAAELGQALDAAEKAVALGNTAAAGWLAAKEAKAALEAEVTRLRAALRDMDGVLETAAKELIEGNDKDFFWQERVADFVTVARSRRKLLKPLLAGVVPPEQAPRKTENDVADRTKEPSESALPQREEA